MSPEVMDVLLTALRDAQRERARLGAELDKALKRINELEGTGGGEVRKLVKREAAN